MRWDSHLPASLFLCALVASIVIVAFAIIFRRRLIGILAIFSLLVAILNGVLLVATWNHRYFQIGAIDTTGSIATTFRECQWMMQWQRGGIMLQLHGPQ